METTTELYNQICRIVADPHTSILTHDKVRAAKIILSIHSHLCSKWKIDDDHSAIVFSEDLDKIVDAIPFDIMEILKKEEK